MFGYGRAKEMKSLSRRSERITKEIQRELDGIKDILKSTLEISKKTLNPEINIIDLKKKLLYNVMKNIRSLEKIKAKVNFDVDDEDIIEAFVKENIQIIISEAEQMTYTLNEMQAPTTNDAQEYFCEFIENYKTVQTSSKVIKGVVGAGVASTIGISVGAGIITSVAVPSVALVSGVVTGMGVLGTVSSIALGPVGWAIGGASLLTMWASAPSKEEVSDAREELAKYQEYLYELYTKREEVMETLAVVEAVLKISNNFKVVKGNIEKTLENKLNMILDLGNKNLKSNEQQLITEYNDNINEQIAIFSTTLYNKVKNKKKILVLKRRKTIIRELECADDNFEVLKKIKKYFRVTRSEVKIIKKPLLILGWGKPSSEDTDIIFDKSSPFERMEGSIKEWITNKAKEEAKVDDHLVQELFKESISLMRLIKNIITTPVIDGNNNFTLPNDTVERIEGHLEKDFEMIANKIISSPKLLLECCNYETEEPETEEELYETLKEEYGIDSYEVLSNKSQGRELLIDDLKDFLISNQITLEEVLGWEENIASQVEENDDTK